MNDLARPLDAGEQLNNWLSARAELYSRVLYTNIDIDIRLMATGKTFRYGWRIKHLKF